LRSQVVAKAEAKKGAAKPIKEDAAIVDAALIGIGVKKEVDFPGWYQQVLTKGDMLDYYDVSGCYILKVRVILGSVIQQANWPVDTFYI